VLMCIRAKRCIFAGIEGKGMAPQPLPAHKKPAMIAAAQRLDKVLYLLILTADRKMILITAALKDAVAWIEGVAGIGGKVWGSDG